jgi:acyl-CoA synthetase (AMP-forming)/AMP-acid ligase II
MAFVNPQLTSYKRPSKIIMPDAPPATSTGKILKQKLGESARGAQLRGESARRWPVQIGAGEI